MNLLSWLAKALSFGAISVVKDKNARGEASARDEILDQAAKGDPEALAVLYDQFSDKIYSYIYHRVGHADLAEDLTGQVFIRMLEAVRVGRAWRTSFSGWLYRIAHNLVIDYYRRRGRATFIDLEEAAPVQSQHGDPIQAAEAVFDRQRLRAALNSLTEEQAQVITLRFLEELSIAETAEIMGKTEGAIKAQQYRAVLALRRVMES